MRLAALVLAAAWWAPAGAADLDFVVVGHLRGDATGEDLAYLDELVREIARLEPDFVVLTGDLVWGDVNAPASDVEAIRRDWERLDAALEPIGSPVHVVPGNHDVNDVPTRDLFLERYGPLPRAVRYGDVLVLLVSSAWIPADDDTRKHPHEFIRGKALDDDQIAFLETELGGGGHAHAFVFMHHMLWWNEGAPWWSRVHPLLARAGASAVFAGDYGPLKFSATERDGVRYIQSSVENDVSLDMLRALESSRVLSAQLDNFLLVQVRGPDVRYEVKTVAPFSGKFSPDQHRAVHEYDRWTLGRRVQRKLSTPAKLLRGLALVAGAGFAAGLLLGAGGLALLRRRRSR